MEEIEAGKPPWIDRMEDFYYKFAGDLADDGMKDLGEDLKANPPRESQRYKSVGLADPWRKFMYSYTEGRYVEIEKWLNEKLAEMERDNHPPPAQGQPNPPGGIQRDPAVRARVEKLLAASKKIGTKPKNPFDAR